MIEYIRLLRPLQWLKNVFVFAPIFFSNNLLKPEYFWPTLVVFASFCLVSSSIYCFNDLRDVEADRQHPKKCHRPIASGKVSVKGGYAMMALSMMGALALIPMAQSHNTPYLYFIVMGYWLMNVAYCIRLKQYAILDVSIIAIGFVMRVLAGGLTTDIWISHWLVMMTFLVTLFLAFTKRNDDYRIYEQTGTKPRVSITGYNKTFINEACISHQRLGTGRSSSVSPEYDCLRSQRFPYEESRKRSFHPVLHPWLDCFILCDYLSDALIFN